MLYVSTGRETMIICTHLRMVRMVLWSPCTTLSSHSLIGVVKISRSFVCVFMNMHDMYTLTYVA